MAARSALCASFPFSKRGGKAENAFSHLWQLSDWTPTLGKGGGKTRIEMPATFGMPAMASGVSG